MKGWAGREGGGTVREYSSRILNCHSKRKCHRSWVGGNTVIFSSVIFSEYNTMILGNMISHVVERFSVASPDYQIAHKLKKAEGMRRGGAGVYS